MPLDEDKYPTESGRRRFVKGVVGSAALSSVGAGGAAAMDTTTGPLGEGGGFTRFFGIENTAGPAPRGMPIIPIQIENGELKGQPPKTTEELSSSEATQGFNGSGVPYTFSWFQYCGVQSYAGMDPELDADNFFRAKSGYDWMGDIEAGTKLTVDMFDDYREWGNGIGQSGLGKPAMASWRSQSEGATTIPIQILRSPRVERMANGEGKWSELDDSILSFLQGATQDHFIAWLNKCTHFCCVPGFKRYDAATKFGAENDVYCPCHQSIYDPFSPVQKNFIALPRPD